VSGTIDKIGKYFSGTSQYPRLTVVSPDEYRDVISEYSGTPKIKVSDYCVDVYIENRALKYDFGGEIENPQGSQVVNIDRFTYLGNSDSHAVNIGGFTYMETTDRHRILHQIQLFI
jgi:hypothetical protein